MVVKLTNPPSSALPVMFSRLVVLPPRRILRVPELILSDPIVRVP